MFASIKEDIFIGIKNSIDKIIPETILVVVGCILIILWILKGGITRKYIPVITFLALVLCSILLIEGMIKGMDGIEDKYGSAFWGAIKVDAFASFFKIICTITSILVIIFSWKIRGAIKEGIGEYFIGLVFCLFGIFLMTGATDLLMVYLSIEFVSMTSFVLTGFLKGDRRSSEAALKYVLYSACASGVMLYGLSLIYGVTGSVSFDGIKEAILNKAWMRWGVEGWILFSGSVMVLAGFGYKCAIVPFHMWCPDVYEGAPTPITAFLSVAPKAAGFAIMTRFFLTAFCDAEINPVEGTSFVQSITGGDWQVVIAGLSILTMTVGNVAAILQDNVKRLLAYSSIAHAGYLLTALPILDIKGIEAMLLYFVIYLLMNLGAFFVVIIIEEKYHSADIASYRGLGWKNWYLGIVLTIFLISLVGLPPLAGFIGKVYLFGALVKNEWYWLAVIAVLNSVVSLYYYARIIKAMFLEGVKEEEFIQEEVKINITDKLLLGVLSLLIIIIGVYWAPLLDWIKYSASALVR